MSDFDHNVDLNPKWKPLVANRRYQCAECGNVETILTNHTGACYPVCRGKCRHIVDDRHGGRRVSKQTKHTYVEGN